jgi:outer membrane lipoprotein SlyB
MESWVVDVTTHPILTSSYEVRLQGQGETTAERVVGGGGLGALIGGIAGGGRGAGIGAAAGAATGATVSAATEGSQISIPSESLLEFWLEQPTSLPVAR